MHWHRHWNSQITRTRQLFRNFKSHDDCCLGRKNQSRASAHAKDIINASKKLICTLIHCYDPNARVVSNFRSSHRHMAENFRGRHRHMPRTLLTQVRLNMYSSITLAPARNFPIRASASGSGAALYVCPSSLSSIRNSHMSIVLLFRTNLVDLLELNIV